MRCHVCRHAERGRVDWLLATGATQSAVAEEFGLARRGLGLHYKNHVTARFKAMARAQHSETFEKLLKDATEANSESVDVLNLLIRGHTSQWAVALQAGDYRHMLGHSARILQALEVRSRITLELAPPGGITVNNFLMRDAAELVATLRGNEEAVASIEEWYKWRTQGRLIEAKANEPEPSD
jgi:hypothetical protein